VSAPAARRAMPSPFAAAFAYALRIGVPPKRVALLALPFVGALLFGLLARTVDEPTASLRFATIGGALFGLILPLVSLVVGDAVLGAEVRAGTFALTWLSPVRFSTIVLARFSAGWLVARRWCSCSSTSSWCCRTHTGPSTPDCGRST